MILATPADRASTTPVPIWHVPSGPRSVAGLPVPEGCGSRPAVAGLGTGSAVGKLPRGVTATDRPTDRPTQAHGALR
jgi:hypothetical protein